MEVDAPAPALLEYWRDPLDAEELARAARFYFDPDRAVYLAAHWLLRTALAEAGTWPAAAWRFVRGAHGKPRLDPACGHAELSFNLSHTKGLVACAIATAADVGIDVELIAPRHAGLDIAERYFSTPELALLRAAEPQQQVQRFFQLWTLKEALIKATGEGLQRPLDSFSFAFDPTRVAFHPDDPDEALRWTFWQQRPTARHALALATRQPARRPVRLSISRVRMEQGSSPVIERTPSQILDRT
jgi:4'-phosphopantetheinyl transferase